MRKTSLTIKITIFFIVTLTLMLIALYVLFYNLAHERMLKSEEEKAVLIAKTFEPMIGMNYYLNLNEEIIALGASIIKNPLVIGADINIEDTEIYNAKYDENKEHIHIAHPINHPVTNEKIGYINLAYTLKEFNKSFENIQLKMINYLLVLGAVFIMFGLFTQQLLKPLGQIAEKLKAYRNGIDIDFSSIRKEVETNEIIDAFDKMLLNIKEHNIMLERYKYAVDESSIVSKTDLDGNITYVNNEFIKVSGYSERELLGSNHRILRHKDMNNIVYKDMWETLQNKQTWKGVLKNRRKDGSFYYVKSIIVPIFDENMNTIEYISIRHDITKVVLQQEQIARQTTDVLTGLPNKVKLEEDIKSTGRLRLAIVEVDSFHIIEDYYGSAISKKTLKEISAMLIRCSIDQNINIYKLNFAQFAFIGDGSLTENEFDLFCKKVLGEIASNTLIIDYNTFNVSATAGVTYINNNAFSNAYAALHYAQDLRNDLVVYENINNITQEYENNLKWTKDLKNALDENRITVYVQPIYDAKTLSINKYECLVRMIGENHEVFSPYLFLDIAKKSKLYSRLTKRVITISFEVFSKLPDMTFSINLSVDDLIDNDTMEFLKEKIEEYNIASQLILEIVESEGIDTYDEVLCVVRDLKALGCQISIDDFGTGYSNFAYLMQLNVDYIKIDGSLIKDIVNDKNSQIISKTILDFSHELELKTVAEYIHNEDVMKYVQAMGVDYLQGFHLGEPKEIEKLLQISS